MYNQYPQYYNYSNQQIVRVNGENGARSYQMPPNSSALLLDESAPIVWLIQTDGAAYKTITPYRIEQIKQADQNDLQAILERIDKLEALINDKSDYRKDAEPSERGQAHKWEHN